MQTYIGNIVTTYKKDKFPPFFNVTTDITNTIEGIPTLIIGLESARENIEDFSIIKRRYKDNSLWWTYKKTERKYEFDTDTRDFYDYTFKRYLDEIKYYYIDITKLRYGGFKKIINWISDNSIHKYCFLTRESNFIFIYTPHNKTVFGLSLSLCEYMWTERKKVVELIKRNRSNRFVYDTSFINGDIKGAVGNNTHYILPLYDIIPKG